MRRRLAIKKRIQRRRSVLRTIARQRVDASKSGTGAEDFCLVSAGLTDPFVG